MTDYIQLCFKQFSNNLRRIEIIYDTYLAIIYTKYSNYYLRYLLSNNLNYLAIIYKHI